jgi:hypothetical protein
MKLIVGREFRDRMSSLPWKSARWVSFRVALTSNPISAGFSFERLLSLVGFATGLLRCPGREIGGFNQPFRL